MCVIKVFSGNLFLTRFLMVPFACFEVRTFFCVYVFHFDTRCNRKTEAKRDFQMAEKWIDGVWLVTRGRARAEKNTKYSNRKNHITRIQNLAVQFKCGVRCLRDGH